MLIARIASASPQAGWPATSTAITAVVIGGTSLFGGRGTVIGTLFGALIVGVLRNGLVARGVDVLCQILVTGVLVIVAVAVDQMARKVQGMTEAQRNADPVGARAREALRAGDRASTGRLRSVSRRDPRRDRGQRRRQVDA